MKSKAILLASLAIMTAASTGCSGSKTVSSAVDPTPVSPRSIAFEWQTAYENKLSEFISSEQYRAESSGGIGASMFDLRDLTGDGTPELVISPDTDHGTPCQVYSYENGAVSSLGETGDYGMFRFLPELNLVSDEYQGSGFTIGKYMAFQNGELVPVITYSDNTASAASGAIIVHEINGEEVSLPEFDEALKDYRSSPSFNLGRKYSFGDTAVDYAIHCSESWGAVLSPAEKELYRGILSQKMEEAVAMDSDAGFELCDLNSDEKPELIISQGTYDGAACTIYYINGENLEQLGGAYGTDGRLGFDIGSNVFYTYGAGENTYYSVADSNFSAADYTPSDSSMECGRKYLLTADNISIALQ